jgi:hypothetical protein
MARLRRPIKGAASFDDGVSGLRQVHVDDQTLSAISDSDPAAISMCFQGFLLDYFDLKRPPVQE